MTEKKPVFTVFQLTNGIQNLLGTVFSEICVTGEILDLKRSGAGHSYFLLKDERAQISAVLWNRQRRQNDFELKDGLEVVCEGKLEVYPPRGSYQLIVTSIEPKGQGILEKQFLALKRRLEEEGLFDRERKKPIPRSVTGVGVVTSPAGAAIRDFLQVLRRRWLGVNVCVFPSPVQGDGAAEKLVEGIEFFNRYADRLGIDCIALIRGGGSMEDLWEFNSEDLVRAVCDSDLPIISGVGHEIDVTLCDLAADVRALTPSEAAEIISPDCHELKQRLKRERDRFFRAINQRFERWETDLDYVKNNSVFRFPFRTTDEWIQKLDYFEERLNFCTENQLELQETKMGIESARLEALSPVKVLSRGYSVTQKIIGGNVGDAVYSVEELVPGARISTRFAFGRCESVVEKVESCLGFENSEAKSFFSQFRM